MKANSFTFFILALLCFGCQNNNEELFDTNTNQALLERASDKEVFVTVPFKTDLSVWDVSDYTDTRCGEYPVFYLTMEGNGNITHMGKITTVFTFCVDTSTGYYYDTDVSFVAANGDELYAQIPTGQILPNEGENSDYYQTFFNDLMIFNGGTGRFQDASGEAYTNAYVHDGEDEWRTDFFSEGFLILKKGKPN